MTFIYRYLLIVLIPVFFLSSCKALKPKWTDTRKVPVQADERARKNIEEGRGISIGSVVKRGGTNYEFSTSNPMWRASLETLDFLPFTTVDYSGGIIITDWYSDNSNTNESIKLTLRFLSNEIATNSIKVIVHKKKCLNNSDCVIKVVNSKITEELIASILSKASEFEKQSKKPKKKKK